MAESPLVSGIVATHNMGRFVGQAIESVLAQDYAPVEVIVVDDGSTDGTDAVLQSYANNARVRIVRQTHSGQAATKNRGFREARGEFVGFCDADDTWLPDKVTRQVAAYAAAPRVGVVAGDATFIDENDRVLSIPNMTHYSGRITRELLIDNFIAWPTALVRRGAIEEAGGFDERLTMAVDYDLWLRVSIKHEFLCLPPPPLARYRIWSGQMSSRKEERLDNSFALMERFLARPDHGLAPADIARAYAHIYVSRGLWRAHEGRTPDAWDDFYRAFRWRALDVRLWRAVAHVLLRRRPQWGPT